MISGSVVLHVFDIQHRQIYVVIMDETKYQATKPAVEVNEKAPLF
jgi:hypothetical protein